MATPVQVQNHVDAFMRSADINAALDVLGLRNTIPGNYGGAIDMQYGRLLGDDFRLAIEFGTDRRLYAYDNEVSVYYGSRSLVTESAIIVFDWNNGYLNDQATGYIKVNLGSSWLVDAAEQIAVDWENRLISSNDGSESADFANRLLLATGPFISVNYEGRQLLDATEQVSVYWGDRLLRDSAGNTALSWETRNLGGVWKDLSTTRSGAGAIPITHRVCKITTTGASQAMTLADGSDGQRLTLLHDVDGGSAIITPTTKTGFGTITLTNVGDNCEVGFYTGRGWVITSPGRGATIA